MNFWKAFKEIFGKRFEGGAIRCAYCGAWLLDAEDERDFGFKCANATADHVIPRSKGGPHSPSNLVPCCKSCNSKKGKKIFGEQWVPDKYDGSVREDYLGQMQYVAARASGYIDEKELGCNPTIRRWYNDRNEDCDK